MVVGRSSSSVGSPKGITNRYYYSAPTPPDHFAITETLDDASKKKPSEPNTKSDERLTGLSPDCCQGWAQLNFSGGERCNGHAKRCFSRALVDLAAVFRQAKPDATGIFTEMVAPRGTC